MISVLEFLCNRLATALPIKGSQHTVAFLLIPLCSTSQKTYQNQLTCQQPIPIPPTRLCGLTMSAAFCEDLRRGKLNHRLLQTFVLLCLHDLFFYIIAVLIPAEYKMFLFASLSEPNPVSEFTSSTGVQEGGPRKQQRMHVRVTVLLHYNSQSQWSKLGIAKYGKRGVVSGTLFCMNREGDRVFNYLCIIKHVPNQISNPKLLKMYVTLATFRSTFVEIQMFP